MVAACFCSLFCFLRFSVAASLPFRFMVILGSFPDFIPAAAFLPSGGLGFPQLGRDGYHRAMLAKPVTGWEEMIQATHRRKRSVSKFSSKAFCQSISPFIGRKFLFPAGKFLGSRYRFPTPFVFPPPGCVHSLPHPPCQFKAFVLCYKEFQLSKIRFP